LVAPQIVLVTGASGAGKTELVRAVAARQLSGIGCYYFDSIGVPSPEAMIADYGSGEGWQSAMMHHWAIRLMTNADGVTLAILDGQVRPTFAQMAFRAVGAEGARIILVESEAAVRHARLRGSRQQPELVSAQMDAWAAYLRGQADALALPIIDTTHCTPGEAAHQLLGLLGR